MDDTTTQMRGNLTLAPPESEGIGSTYRGLADEGCPACGYHTAHEWAAPDVEISEYECIACDHRWGRR